MAAANPPAPPGDGYVSRAEAEAANLRAQMDVLLEALRDIDHLQASIPPWMQPPTSFRDTRARYAERYRRCYQRYVQLTGSPPVVEGPPRDEPKAAPSLPPTPESAIPVPRWVDARMPRVPPTPPLAPPMPPDAQFPTAARAQPPAPPPFPAPSVQPESPAPVLTRPAWEGRSAALAAAARSDLAVHGLAYLGVLLTFMGTLGFVLFAYGSVNAQLRTAALLTIPAVLALAAWFLHGKGSALVAASVEFLAGSLAPIAVFAAANSYITGPSEIAFRTGVALILMGIYLGIAARRAQSPLRFLVAPMLWAAVWAAGLFFDNGGYSAPQVALASASVSLTLVLTLRWPAHRLAAPLRPAAALMAGVGWVLALLFAITHQNDSVPVALTGLATMASLNLLFPTRVRPASISLLETLLLAATLAELTPAWGWSRVGVTALVAAVALLEWQQWRHPDYVGAGPTLTVVVVGALAALGAPWPTLLAGTALLVWTQFRRLIIFPVLRRLGPAPDVEWAMAACAAIASVMAAAGVLQVLPLTRALLLLASALLAATIVVRALRVRDILYDWWPSMGAVAILIKAALLHTGPSFLLAVIASVAALTVALAPGLPALRAWSGAAALAWAGSLMMQATAPGHAAQTLIWAGAALLVVVAASAVRRPAAGHIALIGHIAGLMAVVLAAPGWAPVSALGAWTAGWLTTLVVQENGRSSLVDLAGRVIGPHPRVRTLAAALPAQILLATLPILGVMVGDRFGAFAGSHRSWIGLTDAGLAFGYALGARFTTGRRPLASVLALNVVGLAAIGIAVAAPELWPSIGAVATPILAVAVLGGGLRRPFMAWFAWTLAVVLALLVARASGIPLDQLRFVAVVLGATLMGGALVLDDLLSGLRRPGDGLRRPWLTPPFSLGAVTLPAGLAFSFLDGPSVYGWWLIGAGGFYLVAAVLLRAGAVSIVAEALAAFGAAALLPGQPLTHPLLLLPIVGVLLGVALVADGLRRLGRRRRQRLASGVAANPDGPWLRWDLPPLAVAHLVAGYALARAPASGTVLASQVYACFGGLSLLVAVWRWRWPWAVAGTGLVLIGAGLAGPGWLALALGGTAVGCAAATRFTTRTVRTLLQWSAVAAAGWAFAEGALYASWPAGEAMAISTVAGAVAALIFAFALRLRLVPKGWTGPVATLVTSMVVVAALATTVVPLHANAIWVAEGLAAYAAALVVAAAPLRRPGLYPIAAGVAGWAWGLTAFAASWPDTRLASYSALAAGAAALLLGVLIRLGVRIPGAAAASWGALSLAGVAYAFVEAYFTGWPSQAMLAIAAGLAAQAIACALMAAPFRWSGLRESAALLATAAGGAALAGLRLDADASTTLTVLGCLAGLLAVLGLWTPRPASPWVRPLALFTGLAALIAASIAMAALPDRNPLVLTLLILGSEGALAGLVTRRPEPLYAAPPLLCAAWLLFATQALAGDPEWSTVPIGVALLLTMEVARWDRRVRRLPVAADELVAIEYMGMFFVVGAALVQTMTNNDSYGLLAVGLGLTLALWGATTAVRRRVAVGTGSIVAALVLMVTVPVVRLLPEVQGVYIWAALAGIGILLLVIATTLEQSRARVRRAIRRVGELMQGWE